MTQKGHDVARTDPCRRESQEDSVMNESAMGKAAAGCTPIAPIVCRPTAGVYVAVFVALCAMAPVAAYAQSSCPGIHVKVANIKSSTGTVACALFESAAGFPAGFLRFATNIVIMKIRDTHARCDFEDIPAGTYALAVIHDETENGELDTNLLGVPTEGYGFSNDAIARLGAPSFSAASFTYDGQNLDLTISLRY